MSADIAMGEVLAEREYEAMNVSGGEPRKVRIGKPRNASHLDGTCA